MNSRHGFISLDLAGCLVLLTCVIGLIGIGIQDRVALTRLDRQSAELELVQDCLADFRAGRPLVPPKGWTARIETETNGWERLVLDYEGQHGGGRRFVSLRRQP